jgi:hypothetical protein
MQQCSPWCLPLGSSPPVTAVQRQRPRWAAVFILLLVVCSYDPYLINYLLSVIYLGFVLLHLGDIGAVLSQLMAPTVLAVLILVFTFTRGTEVATARLEGTSGTR